MTEKISQNTNLLKKSWRALTYDWDILATYGTESKLYCLTDFQAAWLLSNTDYFAWSNRWVNCPCEEDDMYAMKAELEYNLMNCFDTRWMGQLQYAYDQLQAGQLEQYQVDYDVDGIAGINPDTPTDFYSGDDSTNRQKALCMACDIYIRSYLNQYLDAASQEVTGLIVAGIVVSLVPGFGLIAGAILGGLAYLTQQYVDACNDSDAINDVVCCMFNGLYGQVVSNGIFVDSLTLCDFESGTNRERLRAMISSDMGTIKNWFSFLDALGKAYELLEAGISYTCDCVPEPPAWSYTIDFEEVNGDFTVVNNPARTSGTNGNWVILSGWEATNTSYAGSSVFRREVWIELLVPVTHFTNISMTYDLTKGTFSQSEPNCVGIFTDEDFIRLNNSQAVNGSDQQIDLVNDVTSENVTLRVVCSRQATAGFSGSATIKAVTFQGTGNNPFD